MSLPSSAPSAQTTRCPSCGALTRSAADWCGPCWADLRPEPEPEPEPGPEAEPEPVPSLADGGATSPRPTWPCARCGASVDLVLTACPDCGAGLLAAATGVVDGGLGRIVGMGRGQRLLGGAGPAIVLMGLGLALLALVGLVL